MITVMKNLGIYPDMAEYEYHSGPELSSTKLKRFMRSPQHFLAQDEPDTAALRFGRAVHGLCFDPEVFFRDNIVVDASTRNTKVYKASEAAALPGQSVYLQKEIDAASDVAVAVRMDEHAEPLLQDAKFETSFFWSEQGFDCRARTDIWQAQHARVSDLKTVADASPEAFLRAVYKYKWHVSAAWYRRGLESCGQRLTEWLWIAVEKTPPYAVQVYRPDMAMLDMADAEIDQALRYMSVCRTADKWPSYADGIYNLAVPGWAGITLQGLDNT